MKYIGVGRVHPERASVYINHIEFPSEHGLVTFFCGASQINIMLDHAHVHDFLSAHATMEHIAQVYVSAIGFALGCGYRVEITQVTDENNNIYVIGVQREEVSFEQEEQQAVAAVAAEIARKDLHFRFAMQDYTNALVDHVDCAHLCYRAIESIAKAVGKTRDKNTNWMAMHAALGTNREMIDSTITDYAATARHGDWGKFKSTSNDQRVEILKLTRSILTAYINYVQSLELPSDS